MTFPGCPSEGKGGKGSRHPPPRHSLLQDQGEAAPALEGVVQLDQVRVAQLVHDVDLVHHVLLPGPERRQVSKERVRKKRQPCLPRHTHVCVCTCPPHAHSQLTPGLLNPPPRPEGTHPLHRREAGGPRGTMAQGASDLLTRVWESGREAGKVARSPAQPGGAGAGWGPGGPRKTCRSPELSQGLRGPGEDASPGPWCSSL